MVIDNPADSSEAPWQTYAGYAFLAVYSIEMVLKILGFGFILNKGSYLRDAWNILDFFIVISGYIELFT